MLVNEMNQKVLLTGKSFLHVLEVAEEHGWVPLGPLEIWSSQPSLTDYLPKGREGYRNIKRRDAIKICVALKIAQADSVPLQRSLLEDKDDPDALTKQRDRAKMMQELINLFQRGWVVVFDYGRDEGGLNVR